MFASKRAARGMAVLAGVAALAVGVQAASATTPLDSVKALAPAPNAKVSGTVVLSAQTSGAFTTVAFSVSKSGTHAMLAQFPVNTPSESGTWSYAWDTTTLLNGKYMITTYARRGDGSYIQAPAFAVMIQNPVLTVRPATVVTGRNISLRLQFAPPHPGGPATAAVRQCVGAAPVTAETWATRCDPATERVSKPYSGLSVQVAMPSRAIIHDPMTGAPRDCSAGDCSAAINTSGLVMSAPVLVEAHT